MADLRALCVYCGSSDAVDPRHLEAAADLGRQAAGRGVRIVFGGGRVGLMGVLADAALAAGGAVTGIIPGHLMAREVGHEALGDLQVVDTMHERKMRMCDLSDAFCALPGGFGTLDETFEIVTWRQLGLHDKPVVLINLAGFWDPLVHLIAHQAAAGYVKPAHSGLLQVVESVEAVFDAVAAAPEPKLGPAAVDRLA
ncbi:MAG: TIGR00730 family Rossman fold protein [Rhodospirillales bacterium]|nr:TIGR00730 family Rossman fold protein [Rhodospirillales bacterium]MDH3910015.1 TIGR00730 family Rossman fold protein [Rhodospirillales bacterium]MDH3916593.1 TIGR00730 family Rossman fold protein [Rhodospirillales bacterium]MDH3967442.1 TIGR00730 family Rossman fold protein [Rhodospirillales bacterium]